MREQVLDEALGVLADEVVGVGGLGLQDLLVDSHGVMVVEGGVADQDLEDEDAQRPPVHTLQVGMVGFGVNPSIRSMSACSDISPCRGPC